MAEDSPRRRRETRPLSSSFERYLQNKGKGRGGDGGNYRRNAARELERFAQWAAGQGDGEATDTAGESREPTFADLDERAFREYARHLSGDRGLKQNTVKTYYRYISAWCGWCVNGGYLDAHYAQRAGAMAPLPDDDGRRPGDQQAWTPAQRHELTRYVDGAARDAIESYADSPSDTSSDRDAEKPTPAAARRSLPYIHARDGVKDGRTQRPVFLRDHIEAGIDELVAEMEAEFGEGVYKTDVTEAAMAVAQEHPELVREKLDEWGYGWA